ncbi:hypothetical protein SAMN04489727_7364 [Amycolatopsis tolypomycina]|uniref:Uncharacterized protein n=1 Tax=Amycolatopsis tolypomycina TaxID=208445 RepID=A0A1H4ZMC9_9PSEU|nr:hypothetical protein [Amycolatopsis tolypomycina]SED31366.1 hypothetical protein SAMN04489727_7364 [Amycolatopsis tolypomycina]
MLLRNKITAGMLAAGAAAVVVAWGLASTPTVDVRPLAGAAARSYVQRDTSSVPVRLRSCDHSTPDNQNVGGCGTIDDLYDGGSVVMRCWRDTSPPGNEYRSPRWFYVTQGDRNPHPGWSGWVYADLVKDQASVPPCSAEILKDYPLPPVQPLTFHVTGSCTTAEGRLTATSSGFTPGGRFTSNTGFQPSGWMYDEHDGVVAADGSIPWILDCHGDQDVDIALSTSIVDEATQRVIGDDFVVPPPKPTAPPAPPVPSTGPPIDRPEPTTSAPAPTVKAAPTTRTITVFDKVLDGPARVREDVPAYLSTVTKNFCRSAGCMLPGTEVSSGAQVVAFCQARGARTTNGNDHDPADDSNPQLAVSDLWYGIRWPDGRSGYLSEVWISSNHRGGLGLPGC